MCQDIVIGYMQGKKKFGLNWEKYKEVYRNLKFDIGEKGVNMEVESTSQEINSKEIKTLGLPIPDTGGGGSGGGSTSTDSDGDGLSDDTEVAGWYAYWYDSSGNKHTEFVTSDPDNPDTDYDGANDYIEWEHLLNPENSDTDGDGMPDGYEVYHGVWHGGWQDPHRYNHRYAVIIVGGGWADPYHESETGPTYLPAFWNDGLEMCGKLINDYHYKVSDVYLLSSRWYSKYNGHWGWRGESPSTTGVVDGEAMWNSPTHYDIKDAFDDISNKITVYDSLIIVIIAHGGSGGFLIRNDISNSEAQQHPNYQGTSIYYSDLGVYLNAKFGTGSNRKYAVMIVVNQACYSGTMMSHLSGENRILITAADSTHESHTEDAWPPFQQPFQHFAFIYQGRIKKFYSDGQFFFPTYNGFILSLGNIQTPESVYHAFIWGNNAQYHNGDYDGEFDANPQCNYNSISPLNTYI